MFEIGTLTFGLAEFLAITNFIALVVLCIVVVKRAGSSTKHEIDEDISDSETRSSSRMEADEIQAILEQLSSLNTVFQDTNRQIEKIHSLIQNSIQLKAPESVGHGDGNTKVENAQDSRQIRLKKAQESQSQTREISSQDTPSIRSSDTRPKRQEASRTPTSKTAYRTTELSEEDQQTWQSLEDHFASREAISGVIKEQIHGGYNIEVLGQNAFLPDSLADIATAKVNRSGSKEPLEFLIMELDEARRKLIVSRRDLNIEAGSASVDSLLQEISAGDRIQGVVKVIKDYGAFVDIGGIDGLLHTANISWGQVNHPSEFLEVGEEIDVEVLELDRENKRISLGMKQLLPDPWSGVEYRFQEGSRVDARVTQIVEYGFFCEIEPGVRGLVHRSELAWDIEPEAVGDVVSLDEEVQVMILSLNIEHRKLRLSYVSCLDATWDEFRRRHGRQGSRTIYWSEILAVTDEGFDVILPGNINGRLLNSKLGERADQLQVDQIIPVHILELDDSDESAIVDVALSSPFEY